MLEAYRNGFLDVHHEIVGSIETGDAIALELRITMTHTGVFSTPMGDVPPTEARYCLTLAMLCASATTVGSRHGIPTFDQASLMAQLGLQG